MHTSVGLVHAGHALVAVREAFESTGAPIRVRSDDAFMASCPLHEDATPSLSVTWRPARRAGRGGVVLLHCFSCHASADVIAAAVGLRVCDLFDEPLPAMVTMPTRRATPRPVPAAAECAAVSGPAHHWRKVRVYTYTTTTGWPVQQVIRQQCGCDGTTHKRFLQRYRAGRDWLWRKPEGFTPVLYRAAALALADTDQWVWLTEGEKDAETAVGLGLVATTNAQGAQSFPSELAAALGGRKVAVVVDRDAAGYQRAANLHEQLRPHAAQTVILLPAIETAKADLTDHVQAGRWDSSQPFGGLLDIRPERLVELNNEAGGQAAAAAAAG